MSLTPDQKLLRRRIDEVLHYMWDPIGVAGSPEARDEYDGYALGVLGLLEHGANADAVAARLVEIEREWMELTPSRKRAQSVAHTLLRWHRFIMDGQT